MAVAALADDSFSRAAGDRIDGSFAEYAASTAMTHAADLANVREQIEHQQTVETMVRQHRDSVSGVSMDEEVSELLRLQKAFQANARVVNAVNQMLELVTTQLGA
jgi:flagellar hook-associated protein 1 FlgK